MKISESHPSYQNFFKREIKTLRSLQANTGIGKSFRDLSEKSKIYYDTYKNKKFDMNKNSFQFNCELNLIVEKKERKVFLEAKVEPNFSLVTYALSICDRMDNNGSHTLLRKFHFDFDLNSLKRNDKPIYHIQYGGKPTPMLTELNIDIKDINPWLSSPRINIPPTNLAIMLDVLFTEFPNETTAKIQEDPCWRDLIKTNEEFIFKEYYRGITRFFSNEHTSNFLFREFYYGKG